MFKTLAKTLHISKYEAVLLTEVHLEAYQIIQLSAKLNINYKLAVNNKKRYRNFFFFSNQQVELPKIMERDIEIAEIAASSSHSRFIYADKSKYGCCIQDSFQAFQPCGIQIKCQSLKIIIAKDKHKYICI